MKLRSLVALCVILSPMASAGVLTEGSITLGQPALVHTGNCDPFGCPAFFGLGTYQQIYSRAAFSGPIAIDEISFFDTVVQNAGQTAGGAFTLAFSYTPRQLGGLDLTNANNNVTTGSQSFYNGSLPAFSGTELNFLGTPFLYNPAVGNLLLTITVSNPSDNFPPIYLDQSASMAQTTNAYFGAYRGQPVSGGNDAGGLVTRFSYPTQAAPGVPEPASWLLLLSGLAMGASVRAFKTKRARQRTM